MLILILAIVFFVLGYKKGFTRSALSFFSVLIAAVLATFSSGYASEHLYDSVIKPAMVSNVKSTLNNSSLVNSSQKAQAILKKVPSFLSDKLSDNGINQNSIERLMNNTVDEASVSIAELFKPIAIGFAKTLLFFIIFAIIMFLLRFILRHIKISKIPVLGKIDSILGGVLGILKFAFFLIVVLYVANIFVPILDNDPFIYSFNEISQKANLPI